MRDTRTTRDVKGGCFTCNGAEAMWVTANAQALAAIHHDKTGHPTWCDVVMLVKYGREGQHAPGSHCR